MECTSPKSRYSQMFKATAPPWKETMRNRCFERFKSSRGKLLNSLRHLSVQPGIPTSSILNEVMEEECREMVQEMREARDLFDSTHAAKFEALYALEMSIRQELKEEEEKYLLAYYQTMVDFQAAEIEDLIDKFDKPMCPVCKRHFLKDSGTKITCDCGVTIYDRGEPMDLDSFQYRLNRCIEIHTRGCLRDPEFSCVADQSSILISCRSCNFYCVM